MPLTYLYRKNGGQVLGASVDGVDSYAQMDTQFFATVDDPAIPDGGDLIPSKIFDDTDTEVAIRNADASELANFDTSEAADDLLIERRSAKDLMDAGINRKTLRSLVEVIISELNILRALHSLPNRTLAQAVNAIKSKIDSGSND